MDKLSRQDFDTYFVPVYKPADFVIDRGAGSRVWDTDGREYVDFTSGIAVSALGHAHPDLLAALNEQAQKIWHVSNVYTTEPALRLAKTLTELSFADKVFFANSGAEANEAALKLARKRGRAQSHQKTEIVSFRQSFHGRTLFTVSVGGQEKYSQDFAPLPPSIVHGAFNDVAGAADLINDNTCAVIVEPIQGEGGVINADADFLQALRDLCNAHQATLIFDEVQTGVGRTGHFFAYMDTPVTPDILTCAKALGGGFPIGAMLTTDAVAKSFSVGDHGTTYGGNPLACAVALALAQRVRDPLLLQGVRDRGAYLADRIEKLNQKHRVFGKVRGKGLLLGAPLCDNHKGKASEIVHACAKEGLLCLVAGPDVLRFAPSLLIEYADIDEGVARLDAALTRFLEV